LQNGILEGRLWWCPSGPFTYLPLHAAAPLNSKFIQSYIPTLRALIHNNSKATIPDADDVLTAVGVSQTQVSPGTWADIPSVKRELNTVTVLFGTQSQQLYDSQASVNSVVDIMQSSTWLHLACHGEQDPDDPLESGLLLYDRKLSLAQILDLDLPMAKFIYLSACQTAMGDEKLANEAMHFAGAFLAAGFQGAIGTLWNIIDRDGPIIAEIVYQTILGKDGIPNIKMAAEGLHLAVQRLRKDGVPPSRWMPFMHFGI
jgi:CHAT domain-containing protein